jgi:hypothetical protein
MCFSSHASLQFEQTLFERSSVAERRFCHVSSEWAWQLAINR